MTKTFLALTMLAALTGELPFESPETEPSGPAIADEPHTKVRLVARTDAAEPGRPLDVAVVLESEPGWHTYWLNPGDAGMATSVEWKLPEGWRAGELAWPAPSRFQEGRVATFGYAGEVWLLTQLEPVAWVRPGGTVAVSARVDWLECKEVCLPGSATVALDVPIAAKGANARPVNAAAFDAARVKLPARPGAWTVRASWTEAKRLRLALTPAAGVSLDPDALFFPTQPGILEPSGVATLTAGAKGGYSLELTPARMAVGAAPPTLEGVLVSGGRAWHVRVPLPPRET